MAWVEGCSSPAWRMRTTVLSPRVTASAAPLRSERTIPSGLFQSKLFLEHPSVAPRLEQSTESRGWPQASLRQFPVGKERELVAKIHPRSKQSKSTVANVAKSLSISERANGWNLNDHLPTATEEARKPSKRQGLFGKGTGSDVGVRSRETMPEKLKTEMCKFKSKLCDSVADPNTRICLYTGNGQVSLCGGRIAMPD